jgi:hypothetical protein
MKAQKQRRKPIMKKTIIAAALIASLFTSNTSAAELVYCESMNHYFASEMVDDKKGALGYSSKLSGSVLWFDLSVPVRIDRGKDGAKVHHELVEIADHVYLEKEDPGKTIYTFDPDRKMLSSVFANGNKHGAAHQFTFYDCKGVGED